MLTISLTISTKLVLKLNTISSLGTAYIPRRFLFIRNMTIPPFPFSIVGWFLLNQQLDIMFSDLINITIRLLVRFGMDVRSTIKSIFDINHSLCVMVMVGSPVLFKLIDCNIFYLVIMM